jgi:hypothetical protein
MIRSRSSRLIEPFAALCAFLSAFSVQAQELGHGVQAHGFIDQSLVHTSDNNVGGESDDSLTSELREMGANLSWRPNPDWLVSGQVLARWAGEADRGKLRLDYGFVDRTLIATGDSQMGLRLGKIKNPYGFYNTTRDVAHTRPGIIMPQSVYPDQMRNFFLAAPGFSLYGNSENDHGNISWQISALRPEVDDPSLEYVFLIGDRAGRFDGKNSWLSQFMFDMDGRWRMGLSLGEMKMGYKPSAFGDIEIAGNHRLPTWVLSLEHNTEDWSFTAEYGQTKVDASGYRIFNTNHTTEAMYAQATRRIANGWQGYLRYDVLYFDKDDRDGAGFSARLRLPAYSRFAKDWVLGVRRDIDSLALSAELHSVDGTAWLAQSDNPTAGLVRRWDMLLLQAAWRF